MKEIKGDVLKEISGGNLTTTILDYFRNWGSDNNSEHQEWHSGSTIESPALGKGDQYGKAIATGLAAIAIFSISLVGGFAKGLFR
ncbi:hypothetical protein ED28_08195 [[Pantoea] beijingensis]|uniref:Uncharacterized protein n=1 Tax=[Pantoea] beijingensis TaxID=1324864 RepID=A0A443IDJ6_9GAMM|nr:MULTISPECIES: hypothetical protein [Erwiniaceae]RWR02351.1 hypothetical protein ED28_08195 [[Pantoea] beijingensis]